MLRTQICILSTCGIEFQTDNPRKLHCTRQHSTLDRVRRWKAKRRKGGGDGGGPNGGAPIPTLFDQQPAADSGVISIADHKPAAGVGAKVGARAKKASA